MSVGITLIVFINKPGSIQFFAYFSGTLLTTFKFLTHIIFHTLFLCSSSDTHRESFIVSILKFEINLNKMI